MNENESTSPTTSDTNESQEGTSQEQSNTSSPVSTILGQVQDRVKESSEQVRNELIEKLVKRTVDDRVTTLDTAIDKRKALETEIKKIKPDIKNFDTEGKVQLSYNEQTWNKLKQAKEKLEKFDKALVEAMEKGNYDNLKKVMNG
jgi:hypothetical protein